MFWSVRRCGGREVGGLSDRLLREKLEKEHMEQKMALQQQRVRQYPAGGNTNCGNYCKYLTHRFGSSTGSPALH